MNTWGYMEVHFPVCLTSARHGIKWSNLHSSRFTHMIKVTSTWEDLSLSDEKNCADLQHTAERGWQNMGRRAGPSQQYVWSDRHREIKIGQTYFCIFYVKALIISVIVFNVRQNVFYIYIYVCVCVLGWGGGAGSSIGIATDNRLDVPRSNPNGDEIFRPSGLALWLIQPPVNGYRSFPGIKCGRCVLLTTHPLLVPRSWKRRAIPLPTFWTTLGL